MKIAHDHFERIMNASPAAAWITDDQGRVLFVNDTYCKTFRLERNEVRNKTLFDIHPKPIADEYHRNIQRVLQNNEPLNIVESGILPDGSPAKFMVCKFPLQTKSKQKRVGGWAIDITQIQRHNEQLEIQSRLLDSIQQAAVVTDSVGNVIYWNKFATELYGWTAEETKDSFILDYVPNSQRELGMEIIEQVTGGKGWNGEMLLQTKCGHLFSAYVIASPLLNDNNEIKGLICVSMDITERKRSEETLLQQSKKLRDISFIQSHEVRRPLSNILALVELLDHATSQKDYEELIPRLKESAIQLDDVVKAIVWKAASDHY